MTPKEEFIMESSEIASDAQMIIQNNGEYQIRPNVIIKLAKAYLSLLADMEGKVEVAYKKGLVDGGIDAIDKLRRSAQWTI